MSDLECLSCERRQICEPIIADTVMSAFSTANELEGQDIDFNPMDAMRMINSLGDVATSGDITKFDGSSLKNLSQDFPDQGDIGIDGYNKLREAGCTLSNEALAVRLMQYVNGNMLSIITRAMEEKMARDLTRQIDSMDTEGDILRSVLGTAGAEIGEILGEMDELATNNPELQGLLGSTISELDGIFGEIRSLSDNPTSKDAFVERPTRKTLEERKAEERQRFIESNGWDSTNLDLGQKLELKSHLRELGLLR